MSNNQPFIRHRFPAVIILCAVRMNLRYPVFYQDKTDLWVERWLNFVRSTVNRWVQKLRPKLSKGTERHLCRGILN